LARRGWRISFLWRVIKQQRSPRRLVRPQRLQQWLSREVACSHGNPSFAHRLFYVFGLDVPNDERDDRASLRQATRNPSPFNPGAPCDGIVGQFLLGGDTLRADFIRVQERCALRLDLAEGWFAGLKLRQMMMGCLTVLLERKRRSGEERS